MWGIFKNDTITLEFISGYLSIGTLGAFIIGGIIYELLKEKKYHFLIGLLTIITIITIFFIPGNYIVIGLITLLIGIFYGLWSILRGILIANEIENSNLGDTRINGLSNIFFIVSIVVGSIFGGIIAEKMNINGLYIILGIMIIGLIIGNFFTYKHIENNKSKKEKIIEYKNNYITDFIAGIIFGITYNLVDSYFYKKISDDNKKSFGRASIGIVASITVASIMFFCGLSRKNSMI